ncbi:MAG TPA: DUF3090 domain-containing protein [Actinomycetota bacterium]|nr:DUF3090 domain-containing protein [Actinomycetota bacterium]
MELGDVDRITADAIGEPGTRTFYLQARAGTQLVTVIVEKEQVQLLATSVLELLSDIPLGTGAGPEDDEMALEWPDDPRWRAGRLSIGYDTELDRFVLELIEYRPELEDEEADDPRSLLEGEAEVIVLRATREQMFALSRYGAAVAERGRPACPLCGNPMDPEGHVCPATNGHRTPRS